MRLWGRVANMNGMSAPTVDTNTHQIGATSTVPQVVKPLPAFARTLILLFLVVSLNCAPKLGRV